MDELGLNKLFAGILMAGLLLMAGIKLADVLVPHSELEQNAYVIEVPEGGTATAAHPPTPVRSRSWPFWRVRIPSPAKLVKKCTACHVLTLAALTSRPGALEYRECAERGRCGFSYSSALMEFGGVGLCRAERLPCQAKAYISGTKMNFAGLEKPSDRANMISIRPAGDSQAALPTEAVTPKPEAEARDTSGRARHTASSTIPGWLIFFIPFRRSATDHSEWFRSGHDVEWKSDESPVTIADKTVELALREVIAARFPDDDILGEEEDRCGSSGYAWVIDGTRAFICGRPVFGVGLVRDDAPIAGFIDMPMLRSVMSRWAAARR